MLVAGVGVNFKPFFRSSISSEESSLDDILITFGSVLEVAAGVGSADMIVPGSVGVDVDS